MVSSKKKKCSNSTKHTEYRLFFYVFRNIYVYTYIYVKQLMKKRSGISEERMAELYSIVYIHATSADEQLADSVS